MKTPTVVRTLLKVEEYFAFGEQHLWV